MTSNTHFVLVLIHKTRSAIRHPPSLNIARKTEKRPSKELQERRLMKGVEESSGRKRGVVLFRCVLSLRLVLDGLRRRRERGWCEMNQRRIHMGPISRKAAAAAETMSISSFQLLLWL